MIIDSYGISVELSMHEPIVMSESETLKKFFTRRIEKEIDCIWRKNFERARNLVEYAESYLKTVKAEISAREPDFCFKITTAPTAEHSVIDKETAEKLIYFLTLTPNGVIDMSAEISGLVETSLNLGILQTNENTIEMHYALRSNKKTGLEFLSEKMKSFFEIFGIKTNVSGAYPPWEFNSNSKLQTMYTSAFKEKFGYEPKIEAIHAGLECGVFSDAIDGIDCISIGPQMYDIHTVNERLSISSVEKIYDLLLKVLSEFK
jgi:dipeptidase D